MKGTVIGSSFCFLRSVTYLLPTCYLPVAYLTIFKTSHTDSNYIFFFTIKIKKSTAALGTTVLSRFVDSLIKKVLLELASVSSFLYGNSCSFIFMLFPHDVSYLLAIASFLPVLILILCWPSCAQTPLSRCLFRMSHLQ